MERTKWHFGSRLRSRKRRSLQVGNVLDLRERSKSFSDLTGYYSHIEVGDNRLTGDGGEVVRLSAVSVSCNFLPLLGVQPVIGHQLNADECRWNGPRTVRLSYSLWQNRYSSDPSIVGRN